MSFTMKFKLIDIFILFTLVSSSLVLIKPGYNNFPIQVNEIITYFLAIFFSIILFSLSLKKISSVELKNNILRSPFYFIFLTLITLQYLIHLILGLVEVFSIARLLSFIFLGFYFYYIFPILVKNKKNILKKWCRYVLYFSLICSVIAILGVSEIQPFFYWNTFDEKLNLFIVLRSTASILFEPNIFAYLILISFAFNDLFIESKKSRILFNVILFSGLILSYSRAAWMCVLIYKFIKLFISSKYKLTLIVFFSFISFLVLTYLIINPVLIELLMLENPLTGRLFLWKESLTYGFENLFLGFGFSADRINDFFTSIGFNYTTSHNIFVDMFLYSGIISTTFYFLSFIIPLIRYKTNQHLNGHIIISMGIACIVFLQFSPHNIGGASLTALNTGVIFGIINLNYGVRK